MKTTVAANTFATLWEATLWETTPSVPVSMVTCSTQLISSPVKVDQNKRNLLNQKKKLYHYDMIFSSALGLTLAWCTLGVSL